jgi:cytochrome c-type biogenesis protein CcmH
VTAILLRLSLFLLLAPSVALAQEQGAELDRRTREVAGALQCPVCQNLSAADSPSELAGQMRAVVREKLAAGQSREEVLAYFVDRYGEEILIDPPKRGFNLLIWVVPPLLLLGGLAVVLTTVRRWRRGLAAAAVAEPEPSFSPAERARYAERLRRDLGMGGNR